MLFHWVMRSSFVNLIKILSIQGKKIAKVMQKAKNLGMKISVDSVICVTDIKIEIINPRKSVTNKMGEAISTATKIVCCMMFVISSGLMRSIH